MICNILGYPGASIYKWTEVDREVDRGGPGTVGSGWTLDASSVAPSPCESDLSTIVHSLGVLLHRGAPGDLLTFERLITGMVLRHYVYEGILRDLIPYEEERFARILRKGRHDQVPDDEAALGDAVFVRH